MYIKSSDGILNEMFKNSAKLQPERLKTPSFVFFRSEVCSWARNSPRIPSKKQLNSAKMQFLNVFDPVVHGKRRHGDGATVILYMIEKFHERSKKSRNVISACRCRVCRATQKYVSYAALFFRFPDSNNLKKIF